MEGRRGSAGSRGSSLRQAMKESMKGYYDWKAKFLDITNPTAPVAAFSLSQHSRTLLPKAMIRELE